MAESRNPAIAQPALGWRRSLKVTEVVVVIPPSSHRRIGLHHGLGRRGAPGAR
ncbi:hypothetical protein GCM10009823_32430 [Brevibacterium salitolerans]|uniref:Uncharacterized protein n=1 Tax=Brevibacterium salitolerans TaxID=1403566 RepID=A0ABN2X8K3_9MICO